MTALDVTVRGYYIEDNDRVVFTIPQGTVVLTRGGDSLNAQGAVYRRVPDTDGPVSSPAREKTKMRSKLLILISAVAVLSGCGSSCESVQDEIQEIGREINRDPETALDRAEELDGLRQQLEDMGCMG